MLALCLPTALGITGRIDNTVLTGYLDQRIFTIIGCIIGIIITHTGSEIGRGRHGACFLRGSDL